MKYDPEVIADIKSRSDWALADQADSYANNNEAMEFFDSIRTQVLEATENIDAEDWEREMVEDYSGQANSIADNAPDVYTWQKWQEFVGTQAWQEDPVGELGIEGDMDDLASVALYMIAGRLVSALAQEIQDSIVEDDEDEDPHDSDGNRLTPTEV